MATQSNKHRANEISQRDCQLEELPPAREASDLLLVNLDVAIGPDLPAPQRRQTKSELLSRAATPGASVRGGGGGELSITDQPSDPISHHDVLKWSQAKRRGIGFTLISGYHIHIMLLVQSIVLQGKSLDVFEQFDLHK
ncbi:hypothetical protein EYF80_003693 [Liparis tanakae]|uniref:Uncharacterized protein n=1 Tax=Liparis tanakae TaxID=230148 RepID=A0A4Z2J6N8_9TELE|nr:hypothetical protein EYF80_003693 [Liparis tanakae]